MNITQSTALVTGANRGIGRALVARLLEAGAARVYAAARDLASLDAVVALDPSRVVALKLDVTDAEAITAAAERAGDVTLVINNAGVLDFGGPLDAPRAAYERNFATNFYGPLDIARAFVPVIERNGGGGIANVLSVVALASMPGIAAYNASKAASLSLTQSLRGSLAARGVSIFGIFPGPVDTDMAADMDLPKTSPDDVAKAIVDGIIAGDEDIFPDEMAQQVGAGWRQDPKAIEKQFGAM